MKLDPIQIGKRINKLRKEKLLTLEQLAEDVGVGGKQTISSWEHGRTKPSIDMMSKLSNIFNVSVGYIEYGTKEEYLINLSKDDLLSNNSILFKASERFILLNKNNKYLQFKDDLHHKILSGTINENVYKKCIHEKVAHYIEKFIKNNYKDIYTKLGNIFFYGNELKILNKLSDIIMSKADFLEYMNQGSFISAFDVLKNDLNLLINTMIDPYTKVNKNLIELKLKNEQIQRLDIKYNQELKTMILDFLTKITNLSDKYDVDKEKLEEH